VEQVAPNGPAARALRAGDIIVSVNGTTVDTSVEAGRIIHALAPGSTVTLGVQRAGTPLRARVRTVKPLSGDSTHRSEIGVALSTIGLRVRLPRDVGIDSGNVVGPSAGLAFALYLVDALTPQDLLRGRNVVATGAVAPDGSVLAVGRVRQKAIATQAANRDLLLVPRANVEEARAAVAKECDAACVQVVPVRSVAEAVSLLRLDDAQLQARVSADQGATSSTPS
jgi:PDZ domain-containing protein